MRYTITICLLCVSSALFAQVYMHNQSKYRFAQLTMGIEGQFIPKGGEQLTSNQPFPDMYIPRIHIGGTHFWGHAAFYVSFPLKNLGKSVLEDRKQFYYSPGIETGAKYYPWRLEKGKIRPYLGAAFAIYGFHWSHQDMSGDLQNKSYIPIHTGLSLQLQNHLLNLGVTYSPSLRGTYYYTKSTSASYHFNPWSVQIGWKYQLETTIGLEHMESAGYTASLKKHFHQNNAISDFSLAVGPSSAFIIGYDKQDFNAAQPFISNYTGVGIFPEFGLGYYYQPWDAHINLSYRANSSHHKAFDFSQSISRKAITLEVYKFLFDYKGFVPFIGPSISMDHLQLREGNEHALTSYSDIQWNPGISFGWDIRPNEVQHWILRTNLRYTPIRWNFNDTRSLVFDQLEFNFIQLVIYPQRWYQRIKWKQKQFSN